MTLNEWMMVERYPDLMEEVGNSVPGCEISSLLNTKFAKLVNCLMCFGVGMAPFYLKKERMKSTITFIMTQTYC